MIKKIAKIVKKIVIAFLILYAFNMLVSSMNIYIPINVITVGVTTILGFPGLICLIILFFLV